MLHFDLFRRQVVQLSITLTYLVLVVLLLLRLRPYLHSLLIPFKFYLLLRHAQLITLKHLRPLEILITPLKFLPISILERLLYDIK